MHKDELGYIPIIGLTGEEQEKIEELSSRSTFDAICNLHYELISTKTYR